MITNLFTRFDPCSSSLFFSNWLSTLSIFFIIPRIIWLLNNRYTILVTSLIQTLHNEFKTLLKSSSYNSTLIFISILIIISINNLLGLFPYIFTGSSHLIIALTLAAPLWLAFILFGWINNIKYIFAHLVPISTPNFLIPFIVLIETISNVIRPGTLTVRLSANIIAGHLLLTLLGNQTSLSGSLILVVILITQTLLLSLEIAVAIIQAYVFTILSTLYSNETKSH